MIPEQFVEIRISDKKKITFYKRRGYEFNNLVIGDTFKIKLKDLPKGSSTKIIYHCDNCGKEGKTFYFTLSRKRRHLCRSCSRLGKEPVNKIPLTTCQIDFIDKCYSEDLIALRTIGRIIGYSQPVIARVLKAKGVPIKRRWKKPNITCPVCKKKFRLGAAEIKEVNFCSKKCRGYYSQKWVSLTCLQCSKPFQVKPHQDDRKFCSVNCANEYSKKGMLTACTTCGKEIWSTPSQPRMFCSQKCSGDVKKTGNLMKCTYCGGLIYRPRCHLRNELYFCSEECSFKYRQSNEEYYAKILKKSL